MVNSLQSVTWRLIFLAKGLKETIKGLYEWCSQAISRISGREAGSTSPEASSRAFLELSLHQMGTSFTTAREGDWWILEADGPIRKLIIMSTDHRMALCKLVDDMEAQAREYAESQYIPEWWDTEIEDYRH
jgi:hypothetical protein